MLARLLLLILAAVLISADFSACDIALVPNLGVLVLQLRAALVNWQSCLQLIGIPGLESRSIGRVPPHFDIGKYLLVDQLPGTCRLSITAVLIEDWAVERIRKHGLPRTLNAITPQDIITGLRLISPTFKFIFPY